MECSAYMHVSQPQACLVTVEARRGYQIPWNWSYRVVTYLLDVETPT